MTSANTHLNELAEWQEKQDYYGACAALCQPGSRAHRMYEFLSLWAGYRYSRVMIGYTNKPENKHHRSAALREFGQRRRETVEAYARHKGYTLNAVKRKKR